jgi:hypothetical protein
MAITKKSMTGKSVDSEERAQPYQPNSSFPKGGAEDLMKGMVGADLMNSAAAKGLPGGATAPSGSMSGSEEGPRRAGTSQPVPAGNDASTGTAGPWPAGAAGPSGAHVTGAGQGSRVIKTYNKGAK